MAVVLYIWNGINDYTWEVKILSPSAFQYIGDILYKYMYAKNTPSIWREISVIHL